jgi:hypothetical protein
MTAPIDSTYEWVLDIQWPIGDRMYDITRVYRTAAGKLCFAEDIGFYGDAPFEDHTVADLVEIKTLQDWYDYVRPRVRPSLDEETGALLQPPAALVDVVNDANWQIAEILNPAQRQFGAIKHGA